MKQHKICNGAMAEIVQRRGCLVGYLTAGYPDAESFLRIVQRCQQAGLHIFEIGYPSKDPYSDGEIIRRIHSQIDPMIAEDMDFWKRTREVIAAPLWLMGYKADLIDTGRYRTLAEAGYVDAFVIPDLPRKGRLELKKEMEPLGVEVLGFTCQSNEAEENLETLDHFSLIYQQLYSGPTGMPNNSENYLELLEKSRKISDAKLFAGFGIGTPERAQELLRHGFDGVVIGTAILKRLEESEEEMYRFIQQLAASVEEVE